MGEALLRGVGRPYPKQQEVIDYLLKPDSKVKQVDVCAGRGWGKTIFAILVAFMVLMKRPGIAGLFLEPDWSRVNKVFLRKWISIIPAKLYTLNKGERCITMINGSRLYYGARNVTGNKEAADDAGRGFDLSFIIDDETAIRCSYEMYVNNLAAIREPGDIRFYLTITTMRYGEYERVKGAPGHILFKGRTADNIKPHGYLEPEFEQMLRASMPPEIAARELDSEDGVPEGQIWTQFKWEPWPVGNILKGYKFQHGEPWYLVVDLGGHGAFQIYQTPEAFHPDTGHRVLHGKLWCCVEEWLINNDKNSKGHGGFANLLEDVVDRYCQGDPRNAPERVFIGHDAPTKDSMKANSATKVLADLGWGWTYPANKIQSSKDVQLNHMLYMMRERRFVVAADKDSLNQWQISKQFFSHSKNRGILKCLKQDAHPTDRSGVFHKDKTKGKDPKASIEDDRDCMLYGGTLWKHPSTYDARIYLSDN
jgi:hypothetical protein